MARVLVTGGAGFIGSHIVEQLLAQGDDVAVLDSLVGGRAEQVPVGAALYPVSLLSDDLANVLAEVKPECIVHLAAQVSVARSVQDPVMDADVNVLGSLRLLEAARRSNVRKIVFASSAAVYGEPTSLPIDEEAPTRPTSPYGVAKYAVEHYLKAYKAMYGLEYTILRYANVYGPRQDAQGEGGVVAIFVDRAVQGMPLEVHGDGEQTRDLVYVGDVARANVLATQKGDGAVLNISSGTETSVNQLRQAIENVIGRSVPYVHTEARTGDIVRSVLDNRKAQALLGWFPQVGLEEGLESVLTYARSMVG